MVRDTERFSITTSAKRQGELGRLRRARKGKKRIWIVN